MDKATPAYKNRQRKSEKLTPEDMDKLKNFILTFPIAEMAAEELGITRQTMHRILNKGVASGPVADKIRKIQL